MLYSWYKLASLLDDIKRMGPDSSVDSIDDPRVEFISQKYNMSKDDAFDGLNNRLIGDVYKRDYFTKEYGWSVPSSEAVEKIKDFVGGDSVLEIGSGYGMWAKIMQEAGISVTPTDYYEKRQGWVPSKKSFTDVEDVEAVQALNKYGGYNVLMMVWPPYADPMASDAIKSFAGSKLIFVGEGNGGCTANDDFFEILDRDWVERDYIEIPRWVGICDSLRLFERV